MRRLLAATALPALLAGLLAAPAGATPSNQVQFKVNRMQPAAAALRPYEDGRVDGEDWHGASNYLVTEGAQLMPHLRGSIALLLSYVHRPLELVPTAGNNSDRAVIKYRLNLDLMASFGLWDRVELGVALPVMLVQSGENIGALRNDPGADIGAAVGDLRLVPKARLLSHGPLSLALLLGVSLPTGSEEQFAGSGAVELWPRLVASLDWRRLGLAFNGGLHWRSKTDPVAIATSTSQGSINVGNELTLSLGARLGLYETHLDAIGDSYFAVSLDEQDAEEVWWETMLGLRAYLPHGLLATLGGGPGMTKGVGTPTFRLFAGLGWQPVSGKERPPAPPPPKDSDGDGLLDPADQLCPDRPEDQDGFEDGDGCPDPDNDDDGVLDVNDKCPLEPEDKDGFEDEDGCPDPDNDGDGVLDVDDKCPLEPEDKDGFEDGDGCPDPDNDDDKILDVNDKCPLEPETVNKVKDEDGCPDQGKGPVQIRRGKITVPPVYFATNRDVILRRSFKTLALVAETLRNNGWIKKVRVEGHTDSRGNDAYNLDLSKRRAASVMRFLVERGVAAARLTSEGFGEAAPIASNRSARGRAKNRRVEFLILDPPLKKDEAGRDL